MPDNVLSYLDGILCGNLVRFAVSRAMFCPKCGGLMDCSRATLVGHTILCDPCFFAFLHEARPEILEKVGRIIHTGDLIRGRWHWTGCGKRRHTPPRRDNPDTLQTLIRSLIPPSPED